MTVPCVRTLILWLGLLGVGLALSGCSAANRQILRPEYRDQIQRHTTLGLLPLGSDLLPDTAEASRTVLTRQGHELFYRLFGLALADLANVTVFEGGPDYTSDGATFAWRALPMGKQDSIYVPVPVEGRVQLEDRYPAFLLLLDDLTFAFDVQEGRQALGTLVTEQLVVTGACEYVLWDNEEQQLVGYGRLEQGAAIEPGTNARGAISLLLPRLAADIIQASPLPSTMTQRR